MKLDLHRKDAALNDIKTLVARTKAVTNTIVREAQQLVSSSTDLTSKELQIIVSELISLSKSNTKNYRFLSCGHLELCSLLFLAIFTGLSLERIQTLRFISRKQFINSKIKMLSWCPNEKVLLIPTHHNDVYSKMRQELKVLIKINNYGEIPNSETSYYSITLPSFVTSTIDRHYSAWQTLIKQKRSNKIKFAKTMAYLDFEVHQKAITIALRYLNRKYKTNITFRKLSNNFRNAVLHVKNDQAIYTLITGQHFGHGIVSSHYYAIDRTQINQTHVNAINRILRLCNLQISIPNEPFDTQTIGSKFPIKSDIVGLFINDLRNKINATQGKSIDAFHNAYTTYIISMLGFATGYRAVCDPVSAKHQINIEFAFLTISDKDQGSGFHNRVIPLTQCMVEQLLIYEDYLNYLKVKVIQNRFTEKNIAEILDPNIEKPKAPYFFYLNDTFRIVSISPEKLKANQDPAWAFPPNVNRHYLRTELAKCGCNPEFIDYFMGHWEMGEEPFNPFSFVSPQIIRENIVSQVEKIMQKDGWKAIRHPYA